MPKVFIFKFFRTRAWFSCLFKGTMFSLQISSVFNKPQGKKFLAYQAEQWKLFILKN